MATKIDTMLRVRFDRPALEFALLEAARRAARQHRSSAEIIEDHIETHIPLGDDDDGAIVDVYIRLGDTP